jgi:lipopolysaccharide assembly protein A
VTVGYLVVAVIAAAVAVFALQNSAPASVRFIVWSLEPVPVAALVLVSLAAGIVVAGLPLWLQRWRLRARTRALEQRVAELERIASAPRATAPRSEPPRTQAAGD